MGNGMPSFAEVAKAYGIKGFRIETTQELKELLIEIESNNQPIVIDVNVVENENCYPMVAPGRSNAQMLGLKKQTI
jgi:acetolactate synthase-1/2/3 large subunit